MNKRGAYEKKALSAPTNQILEKLGRFGLSVKEAQIYLALLELGNAVVSQVAKKSGINRSTTYITLESLMKMGLASSSEKEGTKMFSAVSPERLVQIAEEGVKKHSELAGDMRSILPELKHLFSGIGLKPRIRFFEGTEGLVSAYEDTLTSSETIRAYASIENMHAALPSYFPNYYKRRAAKNIKIRAIFPDTEEAKDRIKHNDMEAREAYLVPRDRFGFSPEINIYDDKVSLISLAEKFALVIESHELAEALKKSFELVWEEAGRLHRLATQKKK